MTEYAYFFNAGQYVFHVDGKPSTAPIDTIALCLRKAGGGVLKHGKPDAVRQWHATTAKKMSDAGLTECAITRRHKREASPLPQQGPS